MFKTSFKIARVWGIPIKVHISLIVLLALLAFWASSEEGPLAIPEVLILEIFIFASIALHELGHSFVAMRKGCRVREITLFMLGGAAQMEEIPKRPFDEFLMAIAGPAVSAFLATAFFYCASLLPERMILLFGIYPSKFLKQLGLVNVVLLCFNLLPAFPMDGGRVVRALLTPRLGLLRATRIAAKGGQFIALLFAIGGAFLIYISLMFNGLLLMILAFFIYTAAGNEYKLVRMQEAARQSGYTGWPPPFFHENDQNDQDDEQSGDKVIISPPPYDGGPARKTDIHSSDEDSPFGDIFRH